MDQQAQEIRPAPCQGEGPTLLQLSKPGSHRTPSPDQGFIKKRDGTPLFPPQNSESPHKGQKCPDKGGGGRSRREAIPLKCSPPSLAETCSFPGLFMSSQEPQGSLASPTSSAPYPHGQAVKLSCLSVSEFFCFSYFLEAVGLAPSINTQVPRAVEVNLSQSSLD